MTQLPRRPSVVSDARGATGAEHTLVIALVACVGIGSFGLLGKAFDNAVEGDAAGNASQRASAVSAQAGAAEVLARVAEKVGGLEREATELYEVVGLPFQHPDLFAQADATPARMVLLHGPDGAGKGLLARTLVDNLGALTTSIDGKRLSAMPQGEALDELASQLRAASAMDRPIVVLENIDTIAKKVTNAIEAQGFSFAPYLDGLLGSALDGNKRLTVIGTATRLDDVDPILTTPERFGRTIAVHTPTEAGRAEILRILTEGKELADDFSVESIAKQTRGYVGGDLAALLKEGGMNIVRRLFQEREAGGGALKTDAELAKREPLRQIDIDAALKRIKPEATREFGLDLRTVTFDDIGGYDDIKEIFRQRIQTALTKRQAYERLGGKAKTQNILLVGEPGVGKSYFAAAAGNEVGLPVFVITSADLMNPLFGQTEKNIQALFRRARDSGGAIILFDEMDGIAGVRGGIGNSNKAYDGAVNQLLTEIQGLDEESGVVLVGTTNRAELIDPAFLRAGRFGEAVPVHMPKEAERRAIFDIHVRGLHLGSDVDLDALAKVSNDMSPAQIQAVVDTALTITVNEFPDADAIPRAAFDKALDLSRADPEPHKRVKIGFASATRP